MTINKRPTLLRIAQAPALNNEPCFQSLAVIGAGSWGTALAISAARAGRRVAIWSRNPAVASAISGQHCNPRYLPQVQLPEAISAHTSYADAVHEAELVLLVVPSQFVRATCKALRSSLVAGVPVVVCAKGIEHGSGLLLSEVLAQELPDHPVAVLSGPSFAEEVAAGMPTAVTVASADAGTHGTDSLAARIALTLGTRVFRPYVSDDVVGVAVGGAVKNVLAIACGIASGLGFGANTRAALITRGLEEVRRLTLALGGRESTVSGLAGIGDLSLTCSSEQSRNMRFGISLAKQRGAGRPSIRRELVEGAENAASVTDLARRHGVEMPICEAVRAIVLDGASIAAAMEVLLSRPFTAEPDFIELSQAHAAPTLDPAMAVPSGKLQCERAAA